MSPSPKPSWRETRAFLERAALKGILPGLERMAILMERMGHPERNFLSIHVTGTNGKGSVCAMIERTLREAGYRTGLYTSPHLIHLGERIRVNGDPAGHAVLARLVAQIRNRAGALGAKLTYFETVTAAAFLRFAEENVDIAVVEVGLGGRLDATNVLPAPLLSIVTNIALDHTRYLGKTLEKIAWEKCGILKSGSVCLTAAAAPALSVIARECRRKNVSLFKVSSAEKARRTLSRRRWRPALAGDFQGINIALVLEAIKILRKRGVTIPDAALRNGLAKAEWPGRFQTHSLKLRRGKARLVLDGAHNPDAMEALCRSLRKVQLSQKNCILLFNALRDKNVPEMMRHLLSSLRIREVLVPRLRSGRTSEPGEIARRFRELAPGVGARAFPSTAAAWRKLTARAAGSGGEWILAAGSLYLAGDVLAILQKRRSDRD